MVTPEDGAARQRAGIQSVEVAALLLDAMAAGSGPMHLKRIAEAACMPASKAHRYLVSLCRAGLVEQDPATGLYDLGHRALAVGLAALGRIDAVGIATRELRALSDRVGATAVLAVWGEHGPTVVRFEESAHPVRMNVRVGSTLPVSRSAIGQVFAAFLPPQVVAPCIAEEQARFGGAGEPDAFGRILADIARRRMNRNAGAYIPGVSAIAAPLFDAQSRVAAVIGLLGHEPSLDVSWDGVPARTLDATARRLSQRLGFARDDAPPAPAD